MVMDDLSLSEKISERRYVLKQLERVAIQEPNNTRIVRAIAESKSNLRKLLEEAFPEETAFNIKARERWMNVTP